MNFYKPEIQIVVSRYNEDLNWLRNFAKYTVVIYNKGPNEDFYRPPKHQVIDLPNVGREGHTYLYHVVKNYDKLQRITIFLPGSANMFQKFPKCVRLIREIEKNRRAVFIGTPVSLGEFFPFYLDEWKSSSPENFILNPETRLEPSRFRPFGIWYNEVIKDTLTHYTFFGIFSVEKSDILRRSKNFYMNLLQELSRSPNPEVGHYIERSWASIFTLKDTRVLFE